MGMSIEGRLEVSIYFGDVEYFLDGLNVLNFLHIGVSRRFLVPTVSLSITDIGGQLTNTVMLFDGMPIRVVVRAYSQSEPQVYRFRLFRYSREMLASGPTFRIAGYFDNPKLWLSRTSEGRRGNSSSVMTDLAAELGLKPDIQQTNDSQLWLPQNKTYAEFLKHLSQRGWRSDTSLMSHVIQADGTLTYRDLNDVPDRPSMFLHIGEGGENSLQVNDYKPINNSGFGNALTGYHSTTIRQDSSGNEAHAEIKELTFSPDSKVPMYNLDVRTQQGRGAQRFTPIGFGNTHDNYETAYYQNMRYLNLMSYGVELMTTYPTQGFKVLDTFNFTADQEGGNIDSGTSGNYICMSWAMVIERNVYSERLEGMRHGTNEVNV